MRGVDILFNINSTPIESFGLQYVTHSIPDLQMERVTEEIEDKVYTFNVYKKDDEVTVRLFINEKDTAKKRSKIKTFFDELTKLSSSGPLHLEFDSEKFTGYLLSVTSGEENECPLNELIVTLNGKLVTKIVVETSNFMERITIVAGSSEYSANITIQEFDSSKYNYVYCFSKSPLSVEEFEEQRLNYNCMWVFSSPSDIMTTPSNGFCLNIAEINSGKDTYHSYASMGG